MSLRVTTHNPTQLLEHIRSAIDRREVVDWSIDRTGDFTYEAEGWRDKARLRPEAGGVWLDFKVVAPAGTAAVDLKVSGAYQGRFIEMLLIHFTTEFSHASAIP